MEVSPFTDMVQVVSDVEEILFLGISKSPFTD